MSRVGISSSCFYPQRTEKVFKKLAENDIKVTEVFINAKSEYEKSFILELNKIKEDYGVEVLALHPHSSFAENHMLFSSYKRRYIDFFEDLKQHFEAAVLLGAKYYVIHGIRIPGSISDVEYFERFASIIELGKGFGILPVQENVVHHRSESPKFLQDMRKYIGEDFKMVLDTKQAYRAGTSAFEFIEKLGESICHVHISDYSAEQDCIIPLWGSFDFRALFCKLNDFGYSGDYIIELYSNSFKDIAQLKQAVADLEKIRQDLGHN